MDTPSSPMASAVPWCVLGAGRAGRAFARRLDAVGALRLLWNRRPGPAAGTVPPSWPLDVSDTPRVPDGRVVVVLAVRDDAARSFVAALPSTLRDRPDVVWLHVAGAHGKAWLEDLVAGPTGNAHPLMTLSGAESDEDRLCGAFFAVDAEGEAFDAVHSLVSWCDGTMASIPGEARVAYHAAAVVAGNGVFALVDAATTITKRAGIDSPALRRAYARLAAESAHSSERFGVDAALTGPAARGDNGTVARHLEWMSREDLAEVEALYRRLHARLRTIAERAAVTTAPSLRDDD